MKDIIPIRVSIDFDNSIVIHRLLNDFMDHWDITNLDGERKYIPFHQVKKYLVQWKIDMVNIHFLMQ